MNDFFDRADDLVLASYQNNLNAQLAILHAYYNHIINFCKIYRSSHLTAYFRATFFAPRRPTRTNSRFQLSLFLETALNWIGFTYLIGPSGQILEFIFSTKLLKFSGRRQNCSSLWKSSKYEDLVCKHVGYCKYLYKACYQLFAFLIAGFDFIFHNLMSTSASLQPRSCSSRKKRQLSAYWNRAKQTKLRTTLYA